jgi:hypothetical protein
MKQNKYFWRMPNLVRKICAFICAQIKEKYEEGEKNWWLSKHQ